MEIGRKFDMHHLGSMLGCKSDDRTPVLDNAGIDYGPRASLCVLRDCIRRAMTQSSPIGVKLPLGLLLSNPHFSL